MKSIRRASLHLGDKLGDGGQGVVFALRDRPGLVYKEYLRPGANEATLDFLVGLEPDLDAALGGALHKVAAWPTSKVVDHGGRVRGYLMPRIAEEFFTADNGRPVLLLEGQYLMTPPKRMFAHVPQPTGSERLALMLSLARVVAAMHRLGLVLGDISAKNFLFSLGGQPRVMLLDCDGIRPLGRPPVQQQAETIDWNDPEGSVGAPDQDRDAYKLALAVMRTLKRDMRCRPHPRGDNLADVPDVPEQVRSGVQTLLVQAAGQVGGRPTAEMWVRTLSGRSGVRLSPIQPRPIRQPPPKPALLAQPRRTVLLPTDPTCEP